MTFGLLAGLIICNVLWSAAYTVSKHLMNVGYHPLEIGFLRYFAGVLPLLIYFVWGGRKSLMARWWRDFGLIDSRLLLVGVLTFFFSPLGQMVGLSMSRAVDGSLLIALEPLVTIVAAWLVLGERLRWNQTVGLALAVTGACILTEVTFEKARAFADVRLIGNLVFVGSLLSESAYSILAKPALERRSPITFLTVSCAVGVLLLFLLNIGMDGPSRAAGLSLLFARAEFTDFAAVLYLGFGCTTFGYLFWMYALQRASVSVIALTLYVQPVLGLFWGHVFLGEAVTSSTVLGAALILGAVWLASRVASLRSER